MKRPLFIVALFINVLLFSFILCDKDDEANPETDQNTGCIFNESSFASQYITVSGTSIITGFIQDNDKTLLLDRDKFWFVPSYDYVSIEIILNQPCGSCSGSSFYLDLYDAYGNEIKFTWVNCEEKSKKISALVSPGNPYELSVYPYDKKSSTDYTIVLKSKEFIPEAGEGCYNPIILSNGTNSLPELTSMTLDIMSTSLQSCYQFYDDENVDTVFKLTLDSPNDLFNIIIPKSTRNFLCAVLLSSCTNAVPSEVKGCVSDLDNTSMTLNVNGLTAGTYYLVISKQMGALVEWPDPATTYIYVEQSVAPICTPPISSYTELSDSSNYSFTTSEPTSIIVNSSPQTIGGCFNSAYYVSNKKSFDWYTFTGPTSGWLSGSMIFSGGLGRVYNYFVDSSMNTIKSCYIPINETEILFPCVYVGTSQSFYICNCVYNVSGTFLPQAYQISLAEIPAPLLVLSASLCSEVSVTNTATSFPADCSGYIDSYYCSEQWWKIVPDTSGVYIFDINSYGSYGPVPITSILTGSCGSTIDIASTNNGWQKGECNSNDYYPNYTATASLTTGVEYYLKACDTSYYSYVKDYVTRNGKIEVFVSK